MPELPETDSPDAIDRTHLVPVFDASELTPMMHTIGDVRGSGLRPIVRFWGAGQTEPAPIAPLPSRSSDKITTAVAAESLRYRFSQASPNEILTGLDPGIRALAAADAPNTSLAPLSGGATETLPDYAVISIPAGLVVRMKFYAYHRQNITITSGLFVYQIIAGQQDATLRELPIGYMRGYSDPLGTVSNSLINGTIVQMDMLIDATAGEAQISMMVVGFTGTGYDGYWYCDFEVKN